jgi:hypothetical protein
MTCLRLSLSAIESSVPKGISLQKARTFLRAVDGKGGAASLTLHQNG